MRTLFEFLSDPDRAAWSRRAQAAVAGLLHQLRTAAVKADQTTITERVMASACGDLLAPDGDGPVTLVRAVDASGCPVTVIIDSRRRDLQTAPLGTWSALVVIDDRRSFSMPRTATLTWRPQIDGGPEHPGGREWPR